MVRGAVQGVGFRWACAEEADRLGVRGWVRNLPDRSVEIVVEGDVAPVERLVEWARVGPGYARVVGVEVREESPEGLTAFSVRR